MTRDQEHGVYIEYIPVGASVKVCAVDARTGFEVSIVGPASAGSEQLKRTAVRKLRYMMAKHAKTPGPSGPGVLV